MSQKPHFPTTQRDTGIPRFSYALCPKVTSLPFPHSRYQTSTEKDISCNLDPTVIRGRRIGKRNCHFNARYTDTYYLDRTDFSRVVANVPLTSILFLFFSSCILFYFILFRNIENDKTVSCLVWDRVIPCSPLIAVLKCEHHELQAAEFFLTHPRRHRGS